MIKSLERPCCLSAQKKLIHAYGPMKKTVVMNIVILLKELKNLQN